MRVREFRPIAIVTILLVSPAVPTAMADLIRLNQGGEIRGEILRDQSVTDEHISVRTLIGGRIIVPKSEVSFLTHRSRSVEEFEVQLRRLPPDVDSHWKLADWAIAHRLPDERKRVLERIIELAPDDEQAHDGLGHIRYKGEWTTLDAKMRDQGYVLHKGKYITPQELELLEKSASEREMEREWFRQIRLWYGWLNGRDRDRQAEGLQRLRQIREPAALPALTNFLLADNNPNVRGLYISIASEMPGFDPVKQLVTISLQDSDPKLRSLAFEGLDDEQRKSAVGMFVDALKHPTNIVVRRAATAIKEIDDDRVIPQLIEALVTTHRYHVQVTESPTFSFNAGGGFGNPNAVPLPPDVEMQLRTGQLPYGVNVQRAPLPGDELRTRSVPIQRHEQNPEVLAALVHFTGQNHGYDKRTWRLWWASRQKL
mgnify:CR=1 FL=1